MTRLLPVLVAATAVLATSTPARADSPIHGAMEFKFGSYFPHVDSEHGLSGKPYSDVFDDKHILLFQFEWEWQIFQKFGSFAVGISAGYGEVYGHGTTDSDGSVSDSSTGLKVFPLKALAVYRFDVLARRWNIPLVPFGKLGLVFEPWEVLNGSGATATSISDGTTGHGGNWGWEGDLGLALQLDWFDPHLAKDMDLDLGINHAYFFAEISDMSPIRSNPFHAPNRLRLNDTFWNFGLALEY